MTYKYMLPYTWYQETQIKKWTIVLNIVKKSVNFNNDSLTWKSKTRVTSCELQVHIYKLRVQIHELQVQIHELGD